MMNTPITNVISWISIARIKVELPMTSFAPKEVIFERMSLIAPPKPVVAAPRPMMTKLAAAIPKHDGDIQKLVGYLGNALHDKLDGLKI